MLEAGDTVSQPYPAESEGSDALKAWGLTGARRKAGSSEQAVQGASSPTVGASGLVRRTELHAHSPVAETHSSSEAYF